MDPVVAPLTPASEPAVEALLDRTFAGRVQARLGELIDVLELPGFVARDGDGVVGAALYRIDGDEAELAALVVSDDHRRTGFGTMLVEPWPRRPEQRAPVAYGSSP